MDKELVSQINQDYLKRKPLLPDGLIAYIEALEGHHRLFGEYIGANVADCDLAVNASVFIDYIEHGIFLYDEFITEDYPLELFLNYVLNTRATKEKMDVGRKVFFNEVKELVNQEDILGSIIDINHWCASEVRYQATDPRTKSALHTFNIGTGRCGEKAGFLVHVFRSVGIPSRQVFSPWWTHSDSNHAWVDVYVDGEWHYLGDGSGEELLDKAWFTLPATRSPLLATSVFSTYVTLDDVIDDSAGTYKIINISDKYTKTKHVTIRSEIENLESVELAAINFGAFRKIVELKLIEGEVSVELGAGDCFVRAYHEGELILTKIAADQTEVTLTKDNIIKDFYEFSQTPGDVDQIPDFDESEEQKARKVRKKAESQKLYEAKMASLTEAGLNHVEYEKLIELTNKDVAKEIIEVLSEKDQEDFDAEILANHYEVVSQVADKYDEDVYNEYLLNPRILWEEISDYAQIYSEIFSGREDLKSNPKLIYQYVLEHLNLESEYRIHNTFMPVDKMLDLGVGSSVDAKILTVAIARSLLIPARYNKNIDEAEYYDGDRFVGFEEKGLRHTLTLDGAIKDIAVSIQTKEKQDQTNINYIDEKEFVEKDGIVTYSEELEAGAYEVIASKRLPSGKIFGRLDVVELDQDKSLAIYDQDVDVKDMVEDIKVDDLLALDVNEYKDAGLLVIGDAYEEPTAHVLNEINTMKDVLNDHQITIYFRALEGSEDAPLLLKTMDNINDFVLLEDNKKDVEEQIVRRVFKQPKDYPFVMLYKEGKSLFSNSGYHVGTINNPWIEPALKI